MMMTTRTDYTARLEARAAYYAALMLDIEDQLDDAPTLHDVTRLQEWLECIDAKIDDDGLTTLVFNARDVLVGDAERVAELIAAGEPRMP